MTEPLAFCRGCAPMARVHCRTYGCLHESALFMDGWEPAAGPALRIETPDAQSADTPDDPS